MKTYFTYRGMSVRISRDCGATQDRFTEKEVCDALESGDATWYKNFIILTANKKIMGVMEANNYKKPDVLQWIDDRIVVLQTEYDSILTYNNTPQFQVKLVKGGKLKAYKEIRDYINTHNS